MARDEQQETGAPTPPPDDLAHDGERFRALAQSAYDQIVEIDAQGRTLYVSPNHGDRTREDTPSWTFTIDDVHDDDRAAVVQAFARALEGSTNQRIAFRVVEGDELRWVECTVTPMGEDASERRALVVSRNITEVKRVEARLRESRERFRLIAENAYDMIAEFDAEGHVQYVNAQFAHVLGAPEEIDWRNDPSSLLHPEDRPRAEQALMRALEEGIAASATYRVAHTDGSWRWIEARYRATRNASGERRVVLIARDRSHDIDAEQRLAASEVRYRELVEKSPLGILVLQDQRVAFVNAAGAAICGAESTHELIGTRLQSLLEQGDVFDLQRARDENDDSPSDETLLEVRIRGLDGQVRDVLATGNPIEFEGEHAYQALVRDITGLRRAERERKRLELQLQESRKLESLGMLAGGIAHDFNNLLAVILANARFALRYGTGEAELTEALEETIEAGERAARLTKQLLAYAGRREPDVRAVDLAALIDATRDILRSVIPNNVELQVDLDPTAAPVRADVIQLEQVVMNLVINAADAIGATPGSVHIATGATEIRGDQGLCFAEGGDLPDGRYTFLEVSDTGEGMDPDTQARIFEPFFTTKTHGHGLGLAAVIGLVKGHGGAVELQSTPGEGTRFRVYLPAAAGLEAESLLVGAGDANAMLWVGDLAALRGNPAWALRDATPIEAADAPEALAWLDRDGDEIALLVCDARVIDDPPHFLKAVQTCRPGLPVLWCGTLPEQAHRYAGPLESWTTEDSLADALESLLGKP